VVQRVIDKAHEIGGFLDENPAARTGVDRLWFALTGGAMNPWSWGNLSGPGPTERASDALRDEKGQITASSVRLASAIPLPEDQIVASIAGMFIEDNPALTSQTALEMAAETVAENRDELRDEFEGLTQPELLAQLEGDIEGRSALGGALESGMGAVLDKLEWWDQFTQWIGINVIDYYRDLWGSAGAVLGGDIEEGFARFGDMFSEGQEFGTTAGEYFGLTGGWADASNIVVGGIFDPSNYLFVGGRGLRSLARQALTQPEKYGAAFLRMGAFPHIASQIANAGPRIGVLTGVERIAEVARLGLKGADEVAALARQNDRDFTAKVVPAVRPDGVGGLARLAQVAIIGVVIAMGLRAMGIANDIVNLAFAFTFGAIAVAVALSFGLGGREAAGKQMDYWLSKLRK